MRNFPVSIKGVCPLSGWTTLPAAHLLSTLGSLPPSINRAKAPRELSATSRRTEICRQYFEMSTDSVSAGDGHVARRPSQVTDQLIDGPGKGDELVMCPYCSKPLPPTVFARHPHHQRRHPGTSIEDADDQPGQLADSPSALKSSPKTLLDPLPVTSPVLVVTAQSLAPTVTAAESAGLLADKTIISPDDIERWSRLAGMPLNPSHSVETEKAKIPLAPSSGKERTTSSSRFGFFRRDSETAKDDEESDDEDGGSGYTKLTAAGSPSDEEILPDKKRETLSEVGKKQSSEIRVRDKTENDDVVIKDDELRAVLREVLGKVNQLVSHPARIR